MWYTNPPLFYLYFLDCWVGEGLVLKMKEATKIKYTQKEYEKLIYSINSNVEVTTDYKGSSIPTGFRCKICGYEWTTTTYKFKKSNGCAACSGYRIQKGLNDLWTVDPKMAKLLLNPEDGYKIGKYSRKKVWWKCKYCGNLIYNNAKDVLNGLYCKYCSNGISYPELFFREFLIELNIEFKMQMKFDWAKNKKYDFYFDNIIVETHGDQHYEKTFHTISETARTLEEEQENDKIKKNMALKNGFIDNKTYIVLDCRKSNMEWIKNSILNSELNNLYDLSKINWINIDKKCSKPIMIQCCELFNQGYNTSKIREILKISEKSSSVCKYLREGTKLGLCKYNPKQERVKASAHKVICLNTLEIFDLIIDAKNKYKANNISACCKGTIKSSGKHPDTREKLKWMYYEDYLKLNNDNINKEEFV